VLPALATIPVSFFDHQSGVSALAIQHLRADGRTVLVYHDAPGSAAARPLLSGVAETLASEVAAGQTLGMFECCVPEHPAEPYIYARVTLSPATSTRGVDAGATRVVPLAAVAQACGIDVSEVQRTEAVIASIHRPRQCAFPGFRQLPLGARLPRAGLGVAAA
jgi:hypothetical protein